MIAKQTPPLQMSLLQECITIPGVQLNMRGISIDAAVTNDNLLGVGSRLIAVQGFLSWAWADYLTALKGRASASLRTDRPKADAEEIEAHALQQIAQYCDAHQIDPKLRREYLGVALFYAPEDRPYSLPYDHYREAMWATNGDRKKARKYLAAAEAGGWSIAELRRRIRQGEATVATTQPRQSIFADYGVVYDCARFAEAQIEQAKTWDERRRKAVLCDLQPIKRLIEALESRAG